MSNTVYYNFTAVDNNTGNTMINALVVANNRTFVSGTKYRYTVT